MQSVFENPTTGSCSAVKYCTKPVYPQSRAHHAACQHENWIYVLAGKDGNISLKDLWRFDLANQNWEKLSYRGDVPPHLQGHTLVSFKKLLLLFGGEFGDALTESSLWIINPDLGYVRKACLDVGSERPCVRRYHSAVTYRDAMYVYGGYVDVKGSSSEFWRYDVEDEEWERILPHQYSHDLPGRRYGHTAVIYKQSMWLYGGMNNLVPKQDLWCYSFVSERWERVKCKIGPPPLTGHSAAVIGSQMVIYGGETNREPVNQVWTFNFLTLKWNQVLFMGHSPPCRSLHVCVMVNPAARAEITVKARSTPHLQNKTKEHIKRPKSSPGYRVNSEHAQRDDHKILVFERTNSAIEMDRNRVELNSEICSVCYNKINSPYRRSVSSDIEGYMHPSPSENIQDVIPLVPAKMDINYNEIYNLDKDAVQNGLDNPGISDSTEKLIEESRMCTVYNQECVMSNVISNSDRCLNIEQSNIEKGNMCSECAKSAKSESIVKHHRLDPELILEDLEFQDCFPYNIQIPFPPRNQIPLQRIYRDSDNLETIELKDFKSVNSSTDIDKKSFVERSTVEKSTVDTHPSSNAASHVPPTGSINYDIFCVGRQVSVDARDNTRDGTVLIDAHLPPVGNLDCDTLPKQQETSFQQSDRNHSCTVNQHSQIERKTALNKKEVPERPYLLIVGGKDKQSTNFTVKPLSLMKLQLSLS